MRAYTIFPLGDAALTIDFGNTIDEAVNAVVLRLFKQLQNLSPHVIDIIPAYGSLTVYYDATTLRSKHQTAFETMKAMLEPLLKGEENSVAVQSRRIPVPVCYEKDFAMDIEELAMQKAISVEEIIRLHTAKTYRVYMIGFLPGFAYMGKVDERIALARKPQPRTKVVAGSVGIAGEQTGIYPLDSPGGWNVIGRTPLKLFDAAKEESVLLRPGDEVQFYSITEDAFNDYQRRLA